MGPLISWASIYGWFLNSSIGKKPMQGKIDFSRIDWQNVLAHLGVEARLIENPKRRGPCPIEQNGSPPFPLRQQGRSRHLGLQLRRGRWCSSGGAGQWNRRCRGCKADQAGHPWLSGIPPGATAIRACWQEDARGHRKGAQGS